MLRGVLAFFGLAVAVLVGGQLVLPRIAERRITSDLSKSGQVTHVSVEAVPAIKLLFGHADRVEVEMSEVRAGTTGRLVKLLRRTGETTHLDARAELVTLGPLRLHGAKLTKDHDDLSGQATVSERSSPPRCPPSSACARSRTPRASSCSRARSARSRPAPLTARDGALVVAPEGLLGGLGSLTLFRASA